MWFGNPQPLRTVYFALINSRLRYGVAYWGNSLTYLIERLKTTQNHYVLFFLLQILPVQHLYI